MGTKASNLYRKKRKTLLGKLLIMKNGFGS